MLIVDRSPMASSRQRLAVEVRLEQSTNVLDRDSLLASTTLYVSPSAHFFACEPWEASLLASDVSQVDLDGVGRVYRRLDADWFAWLVHRTALGMRMVRTGELMGEQAAAVIEVLERLRVVRAWALSHIDRKELNDAINRGICKNYNTPILQLALGRHH